MKINTLFCVIALTTLFTTVSAQQTSQFKFGKIDKKDFEERGFGPDSNAAAVKIFDEGDIYFLYDQSRGFYFNFQRHVRYKIINKSAYELADFTIPLYQNSSDKREFLTRMEAATYNIVNDKIEVSKISRDSKFTETFNKNYTFKKYTLPNVKEGAIIEYKYIVSSPFTFNLTKWDFQTNYPTKYSVLNVAFPEYLIYKPNFSGIYKIEEAKREAVSASYITGLNSNANYYQYVAKNMPALVSEDFIASIDDYKSSVDFELLGTRYPNDLYRDYTGTWPKIVEENLASDEKFGSYVKKNGYTKALVADIIRDETDSLKIVNRIFSYVKTAVSWNQLYRVYTTELNPKTILEKKVGSSADINLLLVNLLREAKLNAAPVLISTRSNGRHPGYPQISKFNSVIVAVMINGQQLFLDAINPNHTLATIAKEHLNHQGLVIDLKKNNAAWSLIKPIARQEKNLIFNFTLTEDNKLNGHLNTILKDYSALNYRSKYYSYPSEAEFIKNFKTDKPGFEIGKFTAKNLANLYEPITESIELTLEDNVEEAGNLVYLNALFHEQTKENLFKQDTRNYPVDLAIPFKETIRSAITFPANYVVEKLPKAATYNLPDNKGSFSYSVHQQDNMVLVKSLIELNNSVYDTDDYFNLKELFNIIIARQSEKIVFKKK